MRKDFSIRRTPEREVSVVFEHSGRGEPKSLRLGLDKITSMHSHPSSLIFVFSLIIAPEVSLASGSSVHLIT